MVRLTRLRIDRFRNVKAGTDLRFGPTFNVLLGKNATGKSTLLDLIAAVTNDNLAPYANEEGGFDLTWWVEHGDYQVQVEARRTPVSASLPLDAVQRDQEFDEAWTVVVRIGGIEVGRAELSGTRGVWKVPGNPDVLFEGRGPFTGYRGSERVLWAALGAAPRPTARPGTEGIVPGHPAMVMFKSFESAGRFDEATASLDAITRSPFQIRSRGIQWEGWLPRVMQNAAVMRSVAKFSGLPGLNQIPALLGFTGAEIHPRLLTRSEEGENGTSQYAGLDCLFQRADGSQISHELLSFGQKRLFAFLWYLEIKKELPVVADELLNGLHHDWIQICFDRLQDRQSFLATQHPFLLDHIPIESADAARSTFVRCSLEPGPDGRQQMVWRNLDEEEAERFFVAYRTGIQHVSEVLRSEGLW